MKHPIFIFIFLLLTGCANLQTNKTHLAGVGTMLARADYPAALTKVEAAKNRGYAQKDRVAYYLDAGMLHHWNGNYEKSNELLELAERAIEENVTKSVTRAAASFALNDNALAYSGEDYEDIYLNAFKALNYLALDRSDEAFVEVRRINLKLSQLEDKHAKMAEKLSEAEEAKETFRPGKSHFQESALGRYLSMLLYRNDRKWDDVRIDLQKIEKGWKLQPDIYTFKKPDFSRSTKRTGPSVARLNVIAFSGQAPDKKADTFYIHTEENLIVLAGSSENYLGKQEFEGWQTLYWPDVSPNYHFKFQLPYMQKRLSQVSHIEIEVVGKIQETLQPLESLENVAVETFNIKKPMIYLKTVTRAVTKGIASEMAKEKMNENGASFLTRLATDLVVGLTENADLRIARFFPADASIRELHLEEGTYDIRINYYGQGNTLLHSDQRIGVNIAAGQLNVLESAYLN